MRTLTALAMMLPLALAACQTAGGNRIYVSAAEQEDHECRVNLGYPAGTPGYLECRRTLAGIRMQQSAALLHAGRTILHAPPRY